MAEAEAAGSADFAERMIHMINEAAAQALSGGLKRS
jgi:hypothetical protein